MSKIAAITATHSIALRVRLHHLLARQDNIEVINEATDCYQLLGMVGFWQPAVVIIDAELPPFSTEELLRKIHGATPLISVIVIGDVLSGDILTKCLPYGFRGFLPRSHINEHIIKAIGAVCRGEFWLGRDCLAYALLYLYRAADSLIQLPVESSEDITHREWDVISGVAAGMTNKEIGEQLGVSDKTVKTHLSNVFHKLGANRRSQLVAVQMRNPNRRKAVAKPNFLG
jgi:NarL family two-component system response regulator YdfI